MKEHHLSFPTRSFLLLSVITLAMICGAVYLLQIDYKMQKSAAETKPQGIFLKTEVDTTNKDWVVYQDPIYPLSIQVNKKWEVSASDALPNYYQISIEEKPNKKIGSIYISKDNYLAIDGFTPEPFVTKQGYVGAIYGKSIYTIKYQNYYYTFDGSNNLSKLPELKTIVAQAVLE